jgi:hypothetical protein
VEAYSKWTFFFFFVLRGPKTPPKFEPQRTHK